jgi:hypothetical protein
VNTPQARVTVIEEVTPLLLKKVRTGAMKIVVSRSAVQVKSGAPSPLSGISICVRLLK